ncbi:hypothetical protein BLA24_30460 [Streptomyces cinnamoneus]|uniref:Uncharacterized protein n=1 Tax=Streptomyces cinnamoneus TaxID=53446 RepID=A0A2G1X9E1_STRCJ|nr:DUF4192 domain-containing protein [Streptomyces cinnamoneus]PHQ47838.1 hypothetical protein BLA24_30460 [Streptomyces cinnamoneus]PPT15463.1 DUF4192 domain-containing protein [Streptomyces cinnamoneus]
MTQHNESTQPSAVSPATWESRPETQITLRSPAELADALPYLMGFHPTDSVVLLALHGERGRFGGRLRLGIPASREEWPEVSAQLAETLVAGSGTRGTRPDGIVLFLCQDPTGEETGREVMERLRPFAQSLRLACGGLDVPVYEALCLSGGRFWSYCCPDERCCSPDGTPLALPGTSVMAAAAAYAGIRVRGTLREMENRYAPLTGARAQEQESALDAAASDLVPRLLTGVNVETVRQETLDLARLVVARFHETPPPAVQADADAMDDTLLACDEAAAIILGLQDRTTRDHAAEWMEGPQAPATLRVWRALARRCVPPYTEHAAAPLTLAGWVAWSTGDQPEARVALSQALTADSEYLFAQLLHRACNEGMDPELLRRCLRREHAGRAVQDTPRVEEDRAAGTDRTEDPLVPDAAVGTRAAPGREDTGAPEAAADRGATAGPGVAPGTDAGRTVGGCPETTERAPAESVGRRPRVAGSRPSGPAGANGPAGRSRTRRRPGPRGVRGRQ